MCDDNWRSIGDLAVGVLAEIRTATEGSVVKRALPPPPRSDEGNKPLRSGIRAASAEAPASCGAAYAGEEDPLEVTPIETEAGRVVEFRGSLPGQQVAAYRLEPASHGHAHTSMRRTIAVDPPPQTPMRPAIVYLMRVVFRSRRHCILPGSSTRPQRIGVVGPQRLLMVEPHSSRSSCQMRSTTQASAISASVPRNTAH
jgi:hypothetical protein